MPIRIRLLLDTFCLAKSSLKGYDNRIGSKPKSVVHGQYKVQRARRG